MPFFFGRVPILYLHPALGVGMGLLVTRPQIKPSLGPSWGQSPREVERELSWNQAVNDGWVGRDGLGFVSYFTGRQGVRGEPGSRPLLSVVPLLPGSQSERLGPSYLPSLG